MAAPQNFRSAFNGFNREDVVHYLEYLNAKHTNQINQLTAENEALRQDCQALRQSLAAADARYNDLRARALKAYNGQKAQIEELQAQLERRKGAGSPEAELR